jgi:hypothetical protein
METLYLCAIACASSVGLWLVGRRYFGLKTATLPRALANAIEIIGAIVLCWALNVALSAAAALAIRSLGYGFVSLYLAGDPTLLAAALLQALVFEAWRRHSSASS